MRALFIAVLALLLTGCGIANNVPRTIPVVPHVSEPRTTMSLFFDANGDLYPTRWDKWPDFRKTIAKTHSLRAALACVNAQGAAPDALGESDARCGRAQLQALVADGDAQIAKVAALAQAAGGRVVIMVHGFNSGEAKSNKGFVALGRQIRWRSSDLLIHIHWDGLTANMLGAPKIWFNAVGNSQVVGMRGLRRVLAALPGKDITLLSHSRGASVLLSALSDPPFALGYRTQTNLLGLPGGPLFFAPPPLVPAGRHITVLLLGPAVGYVDFQQQACQELTEAEKTAGVVRMDCGNPPAAPVDRTCPGYRAFAPEVLAIHYTVNTGDWVLGKGSGQLARYFNPTDFGYDKAVGTSLAGCYPDRLFQQHELRKGDKKAGIKKETHAHDFPLYARDRAVAEMLRETLNRAE